jgi:hypothetical protein
MLVELDAEPKRPGELDSIAVCQAVAAELESLTWIDLFGSAFRGVSLDRLDVVRSSGIDVVPPDHHFYADSLDKAIEYGGWPKVMLALDYRCLDRPYRRVAADAKAEDVIALRRTYPHEVHDDNGRLWLTRASIQRFDGYDVEHGRWIPGDPLDAIRTVIVFTHPDATVAPENLRARLGTPDG